MIHLYSGEGKGKTSIVTGMAVRMAGAGKEVLFAQFMKGNDSSELKVLELLPEVTVLKAGETFGFYKDMTEEDKKRITECHNEILGKILNKICDYKERKAKDNGPDLLIILDEITYPCQWGLLNEDLLRQLLEELPGTAELAMTGRNPKDYMMEISDYWSVVEMKRHPYEKNVTARAGIEY